MSELDKLFVLLLIALMVLLSIIGVASLTIPNNNESIEPQPPVINFPSNSYVNVTSDERIKVVNIAVNDLDVKEWLTKGYEIGHVVLCTHGDIGTYFVSILTQEQNLPWLIGISLQVAVNATKEQVNYSGYKFTYAPLSEEQNEELRNIATSYVEENYGTDYDISSLSVRHYRETIDGKITFYAYPRVNFRFPSNASQGISVKLWIDLEMGEVVKAETQTFELVDRPRLEVDFSVDFSNQNLRVSQGESVSTNITLSSIYYEEELTVSFSLELGAYENWPVNSTEPPPFVGIVDLNPLVLKYLEPRNVTITITADDDAPLGLYTWTILWKDENKGTGMGATFWVTVVE